MDLIFANAYFIDQGVLQDYSFDMEYGIGEKDTNTFECVVQKYNTCVTGEEGVDPIGQDSIIYAERTDYGGIVDRVETDVKDGTVTFKGRTWHGVLNSYVIEPPSGERVRTYTGNANDIISQMLTDTGVDNLFVVDSDSMYPNTDLIPINTFEVRYEKLYDAIIRLITPDGINGKLVMYFYDGQVHMRALLAVNYAGNEEWDSSQTPFQAGYTFNGVNHLICLGQGEGVDRAVIHLFMDDNQHVMPYITLEEVGDPSGDPVENGYCEYVNGKYVYSEDRTVDDEKTYYLPIKPVQDSDFILDKSEMMMSGIEERTAILDYDSAEIIKNYLPLSDIYGDNPPPDWKSQYTTKYYQKVEDETVDSKYVLFEEQYRDEYELQTSKPNGWDDAEAQTYKDYFYKDTTKEGLYVLKYKEGTNIPIYVKAKETDKGATEYLFKMSAVKDTSEVTNFDMHVLTEKYGNAAPPDWSVNYGKYYTINGLTPSGQPNYVKVSSYSYTTYGQNANDGNEAYPDGHPLAVEPKDWGWNYKHYYYRTAKENPPPIGQGSQYDYHHVEDFNVPYYEAENGNISNAKWAKTWKDYYIKGLEVTVVINGVSVTTTDYYTTQEAVENEELKLVKGKTYPKYKAGKYYKKVIKIEKPAFNATFFQIQGGIFESFSHDRAPDYVPGQYYYGTVSNAPTWQPNTYYTLNEEKLQIPTYDKNNAYYQVLDRLSVLSEKGVEKLKELNNTSTLNIDLELDSDYDVGDIFGVHDEVTGIEVTKTILRKIIRIKKEVVSVEYAVE